MKVRELVELLSKQDQDAEIILTDADGGGYDCTYYRTVSVTRMESAEILRKWPKAITLEGIGPDVWEELEREY